MRRERLINELQDVCDRITGQRPPLNITAIYMFGSLPRNIKQDVGDADLIIIANTDALRAFNTSLETFLMQPAGPQKILRDTLIRTYRELSDTARDTRDRGESWTWPKLLQFLSEDSYRDILKASGVVPEWMSCYTWNELFNWRRFGYPEFGKLTVERLVQRALFGFKRGYEVTHVGENLQEVLDKMVIKKEEVVLAWSPKQPDVKRNLTGIDHRGLVNSQYENMWGQLEIVNAKNIIMLELCRYYRPRIENPTRIDDKPHPNELLELLAKQIGISLGDMTKFLDDARFSISRSAVAELPSLVSGPRPELKTEDVVETLRSDLQFASNRFYALVELCEGLRYLLQSDRLPSDIGAYLLEQVPEKTAPKKLTLSILKEIDLPSPTDWYR